MPAFVYDTDVETFARIAAGEIHALTTMAQARASDPTPMQVDTVNGFEMDEAGRAAFLSVSFHFFTTGVPETVPLDPYPTFSMIGIVAAWYVFPQIFSPVLNVALRTLYFDVTFY